MTVQTVNVTTLKRVKNNVIGNPSAKLLLAQDELFVATYVTCRSPLFHLTLPPLPALSSALLPQNNSRRLQGHRTISVSRLPTSSPRYPTVRNRYCGRMPLPPIDLRLSPFYTRLSRSSPQRATRQRTSSLPLCHLTLRLL